jgi:hypothetical protein
MSWRKNSRTPHTAEAIIAWAKTAKPGEELVYMRALFAVGEPELVRLAQRLADSFEMMLFQRPSGIAIDGCKVYEYVMKKLRPTAWSGLQKVRYDR